MGSIYLDAVGERYRVAPDTPLYPFSCSNWLMLVTDRDGVGNVLKWEGTTMDYGVSSSGTILKVESSTAGNVLGSELSLGVWYFLALVNTGSSMKLYLNGNLDIDTPTGQVSTTMLSFGSTPGGSQILGRIAALNYWKVELSQEEIIKQMYYYKPVVKSDYVFASYPMLNVGDEIKDYSSRGKTLERLGSPSDAEGPPISWEFGRTGYSQIFFRR